jgi:hypothetical protein
MEKRKIPVPVLTGNKILGCPVLTRHFTDWAVTAHKVSRMEMLVLKFYTSHIFNYFTFSNLLIVSGSKYFLRSLFSGDFASNYYAEGRQVLNYSCI